jgi:glycosyltransferase involved in cell wall biosynthesis
MALRIVHVTNETYGIDTANGVQHAVYYLSRAQVDMGLSVAVFSRDDQGVTILGGGSPASRPLVASAPGRSVRQRVLSRYFEPRLAEGILAWRPDIVHFHSVHIPQNVALAAHLARLRVPYCVTVHAGLFRAARQRRRLTKALFHQFFELSYLDHAHFVHALTPHEADIIRRRRVRCPIVVVPNGVSPEVGLAPSITRHARRTDDPWRSAQYVFMFIGRVDAWQKGLDLLVEAFARLGRQDAVLVLVGPDYRGSHRQLMTLAERFGISSQVAFHEAVFGQDRTNLLAAADIFVHPSRWEGVSMSVLAAAAAAKPCVITRAADPLGELERADAAIIVEPAVKSIVDGLKRASTLDPDDLKAIGGRARQVAEARFTWPSIATQLVQAYRSVLGQQRQPPADGSPLEVRW